MSDEAEMSAVFSAIGEDGFRRFVAGFYRRVPTDNVLGPMYPPLDLAEAERRLGDFLISRFGGPDRYIRERGPPRLRMRHSPFAITNAARDRWVMLMDQALSEADLPAAIVDIVRPFLQATATMLINVGEPPLPLPLVNIS